MNLDLRLQVEILRKFRKGLSERFNPENAELQDGEWVIESSCVLCDHCRGKSEYCGPCPFQRFEVPDKHTDFTIDGCQIWLKRVLAELGYPRLLFIIENHRIVWMDDQNDAAREQIKKLRAALLPDDSNHIDWVADPSLRVTVERKYRNDLDARFNPDNAILGPDMWAIKLPCVLCDVYSPGESGASKDCGACPFKRFEDPEHDDIPGCQNLIDAVLKDLEYEDEFIVMMVKERLSWMIELHPDACDQLNALRAALLPDESEYILWIGEDAEKPE